VVKQDKIGRRKKSFPKNTQELTLAAAWKFSEENKPVLIYCTERHSVESYAKLIVDVVKRGFLPPLIHDIRLIQRALEIGNEWLGQDHPVIECLKHGIAIHHARLPNPFLREVENLLAEGILKITVASPTLAQGLNLKAAILLVPSLFRAGKLIEPEEFANVAGRAGRAYVDLEGNIIRVLYNPEDQGDQKLE